jgi:hypothetical protein
MEDEPHPSSSSSSSSSSAAAAAAASSSNGISPESQELQKRKRAVERMKLELEEEELELRRKKLQREQSEFEEAENSRSSSNNSMAGPSANVIKLNVGGEIFAASRETLIDNNPESIFPPLLEGAIPTARTEEGHPFIDRNPKYFAILLDGLRGGLNRDAYSEAEREALALECEYYQLERMRYYLLGGYDPYELSEEDQQIRKDALRMQSLLVAEEKRDTVAGGGGSGVGDYASRTADTHFLVNLFDTEDPSASASSSSSSSSSSSVLQYDPTPSSPRAPLLFEEARKAHAPAEGSPALGCSERSGFERRLNLLAGPLLEGLDLAGLHLVAAGGIVQRALLLGDPDDQAVQAEARKGKSDVDLFLVVPPNSGKEAGQELGKRAFRGVLEHLTGRLRAIDQGRGVDIQPAALARDVRLAMSDGTIAHTNRMCPDGLPPFAMRNGGQILVVRSKQAITFVAGWPQRHIQLILAGNSCVADAVVHFDIDACQVAFDGQKVLATPAAVRALRTRINIADPTVGTAAYCRRLFKYAQVCMKSVCARIISPLLLLPRKE